MHIHIHIHIWTLKSCQIFVYVRVLNVFFSIYYCHKFVYNYEIEIANLTKFSMLLIPLMTLVSICLLPISAVSWWPGCRIIIFLHNSSHVVTVTGSRSISLYHITPENMKKATVIVLYWRKHIPLTELTEASRWYKYKCSLVCPTCMLGFSNCFSIKFTCGLLTRAA